MKRQQALVLDCGNSRTKYAWVNGGRVDKLHPVENDRHLADRLVNEWQCLAAPLAITGVCVAGGHIWSAVEAACARLDWPKPRRLAARQDVVGLHVGYSDVARLGADRWAAMLGARRRVTGSVIVVDAGTAVTMDLVAANGDHRGGVIFPGLRTMRASLRAGTRGLHARPADESLTPFALDTAAAIGSGTVFALVGAVEGLLDRLAAGVQDDPAVMVCGGDAALLTAYSRRKATVVEGLVAEGVAVAMGEAEYS